MSAPQIGRTWDYHDLMFHRIHEILLVASPYDAFILEEDGRLSEQILHEYLGINLRYAPRVWRASTAAEAAAMIEARGFDLVITMLRVPDMDPVTFGRSVKEKHPNLPVVLLAFDTRQLIEIGDPIPADAFDRAFIWTGDARVLMAIIKSLEDSQNLERDIQTADVRAVLLVEDDPYYYSVILPLIYTEIFHLTRALMDASLDDTDRLLRMRARPKVLLASTFEEAHAILNKYQQNLLGVISDTRFPKEGVLGEHAGLELAGLVRQAEPAMPFMLTSTGRKNEARAREVHASFLLKTSPTLLADLRGFIESDFGFGEFIFRTPDGKETGRAANLLALQEALEKAPAQSVLYHASHNHFSNWCAAHGHLELATALRPGKPDDFESVDAMRGHIIEMVERSRKQVRRGRLVQLTPQAWDPSASFMTIAGGSMGGKARGLAFLARRLAETGLEEKYPGVTFGIPSFSVIGTDAFEQFMDANDLWETALEADSNERVRDLFLAAHLDDELVERLAFFLEKNTLPISVRSSSLLEDSQFHSLAGMYHTYVLPNCAPDAKERLSQLRDAVKLVYASAFFQAPKSFLDSSIHRPEEDRMAVILQQLAGQHHNAERFYPTFSGVAQSLNYYPVSRMRREDGIAYVALGLGKTVVENRKSLRFSPRHPQVLPHFYATSAILENSQNTFYALQADCEQSNVYEAGEDANLVELDLDAAERDGALRWVASVLDAQDGILRDSLLHKGPRVVSFAPMLKLGVFPLAAILTDLLTIAEQSLGCASEVEFAGNLYDDDTPPSFSILQIRPMAGPGQQDLGGERTEIDKARSFCTSERALGAGTVLDIHDIVFVPPGTFDVRKTKEIAQEVGRINAELGSQRPYLLIGPGRWGTADPHLGIPATWDQISHARVIVEYNLERFPVEPSFGGHFFQNITSQRIGYLTVSFSRSFDRIDWDWLAEAGSRKGGDQVHLAELERPITVRMESAEGKGYCLRPHEDPPANGEQDAG